MRFKLLSIVAYFLIWLFYPFTVFAGSEAILKFDSEIMAGKNGILEITENIEYDFGSSDRHGILRDIPRVSKVGNLYRILNINFTQIKRDGLSEQFSVTNDTDKFSVRIGNPNKTISGVHLYTIVYNVENGIGSNYQDHDEIYWNITGDQWKVPINFVKATLQTDSNINPNKIICFTGVRGSTNQECNATSTPPYEITTSKPLQAFEGFTIVAAFPVNTFPKSILTSNISTQGVSRNLTFTNYINILPYYFGFTNLVLAPIIFIWYLKTKHKSRFGKVSVNFDIPRDDHGTAIPPAEAGIIDNAKLESDDIVATIFDLAIRKYIKLSDKSKDHSFLGIHSKSTEHFIQKIDGKDINSLKIYEKILYGRLFQDGDEINLDSLRMDFYMTFDLLETSVFKSLVDKGYYGKNPKTQRSILLSLTILSAATFNLILAAVFALLTARLNGRTQKGDELDFKIDGLKLFLKNMRLEYKWQAENLITVEKYIPYAIALGYINEFMKELKVIYPNYQPTWYVGNNFYYGFNGYLNSVSSGLTTSAPSTSSGFSGGGSGGGGGGGGGGSW